MEKALWHIDNESTKINEVAAQTGIKVNTAFSFISQGTERLVAQGNVPSSLYQQMKVPYMKGEFSFPLTYGYSLCGHIVDSKHPHFNKAVHLLHPHQDICFVQDEDLFIIPDDVPIQRATLASNMETALNAYWDAQVQKQDQILIVGFGIIGALTAAVFRSFGCENVFISEKNPDRKQKAIDWGFQLIENIPNDHFNCAIHTTASASGLQSCIDSVGFEGRVIELSWYGSKAVNLHLGTSFHYLRKQIISSQVSHIPGRLQREWDYQKRKSLVFELLVDSFYDRFIEKVIPFEDAPAFFDQLRKGGVDEIGVLIGY